MTHSHGPVETRDTHDHYAEHDAGAGLGMVLGLVLVALLIGAVLWVAFAGWGVADRGPTGGGQGTSPTTNIEIPREIDININQRRGGDGSGQ